MAGHQTPSFRFDHRDVHEPRSNCSKQWKINLATDRSGSSVFGGGGGCGDGSGSSCRSLVRYYRWYRRRRGSWNSRTAEAFIAGGDGEDDEQETCLPKPLSSAAVGRMPLLEECFLARWPSVLALRLPSWLEWNGLLEV